MEQKKYIVDVENVRLDKYLANQDLEFSRARIAKLLENGNITVNGKNEKPSYTVKKGDEIIVNIEAPQEMSIKEEDIPIEVVYEDENMIVVNKPKGLVVHPRKWKPGWYTCKCNYERVQGKLIWHWRENKTRNCT